MISPSCETVTLTQRTVADQRSPRLRSWGGFLSVLIAAAVWRTMSICGFNPFASQCSASCFFREPCQRKRQKHCSDIGRHFYCIRVINQGTTVFQILDSVAEGLLTEHHKTIQFAAEGIDRPIPHPNLHHGKAPSNLCGVGNEGEHMVFCASSSPGKQLSAANNPLSSLSDNADDEIDF